TSRLPSSERASPSNTRGHHKPCGMSHRSIPISRRFRPDQRLAGVSSWCNVQISQVSRKRYKPPSTTGRSLDFLKRANGPPFFSFRMPDTSFHGPASGFGKPSYIVGSLLGRLDKHLSTTRPFRNPGRPFILWTIRVG